VRPLPGPVLRATAAGLVGAIFAGAGPSAAEDAAWCGTAPDGARHALALHAWAAAPKAAGAQTDAPADRDADGVALLADRGDLLVSRNPFDLDGRAVRLVPNGSGGYDVVSLSLPLDTPATPLAIGEEGTTAMDLPFAFPFYGQRRARRW